MPKPLREPVKRLLVITHPEFHRLRIHMVDPFAKQKPLPRRLEALIKGAAKDPGTHVIVSWSENAFPHGGLVELLKTVPKGRRHEPVFTMTEEVERQGVSYTAGRENMNFFSDDPNVAACLSKLNFAPDVEIESWGDYHNQCHLINLLDVADFLSGKSINIRRIRVLGGMPVSGKSSKESILNAVAEGKRIPKERRAEYDDAREELFLMMKRELGKHGDKLEIVWPPLK